MSDDTENKENTPESIEPEKVETVPAETSVERRQTSNQQKL